MISFVFSAFKNFITKVTNYIRRDTKEISIQNYDFGVIYRNFLTVFQSNYLIFAGSKHYICVAISNQENPQEPIAVPYRHLCNYGPDVILCPGCQAVVRDGPDPACE